MNKKSFTPEQIIGKLREAEEHQIQSLRVQDSKDISPPSNPSPHGSGAAKLVSLAALLEGWMSVESNHLSASGYPFQRSFV